jgi:hypothetical protein
LDPIRANSAKKAILRSSFRPEAVMAIRPFLSGQAFEPETIRDMSIALEGVCQDLVLRLRDEAATRLVAQKIIKFAQWGIRDAPTIRAMTLKEFRSDSEAN